MNFSFQMQRSGSLGASSADHDACTCNICGKQFCNPRSARNHIDVVHRGIYPFKCTVCGQSFSQLINLKGHMRRHTGERFTCSFCQRQFMYKHSWQNHERLCEKRPVNNFVN